MSDPRHLTLRVTDIFRGLPATPLAFTPSGSGCHHSNSGPSVDLHLIKISNSVVLFCFRLEDGKFLRNIIKNGFNKPKYPDTGRHLLQSSKRHNMIYSFMFKSSSSWSSLSLLTGLSGCAVYKYLLINTVHCKTGVRVVDKPAKSNFDWKKFFELIWPDIWSLVGAVLVSLLLKCFIQREAGLTKVQFLA